MNDEVAGKITTFVWEESKCITPLLHLYKLRKCFHVGIWVCGKTLKWLLGIVIMEGGNLPIIHLCY